MLVSSVCTHALANLFKRGALALIARPTPFGWRSDGYTEARIRRNRRRYDVRAVTVNFTVEVVHGSYFGIAPAQINWRVP